MTYGYGGNILRIDLSRGKVSKTPTSEYARLFIGGRGINSKLFFDLSSPGVDAFHPDTPIIIGAGALCGTGILGMTKHTVMSRSPEQVPQGLGFQLGGGSLSSEMKYAGYDHIAIVGRAEKPTYVQINDDDVALKDASALWGKGVFETEAILKKDIEPEVKVQSIGPAGEKLVRFATIEHEWRSGTGLGGIWGSKNLKAIAVRGTKGIKVYDPEAILKINEVTVEKIKKEREEMLKFAHEHGIEPQDLGESAPGYHTVGATASIYNFHLSPTGVVGYFEGQNWPDVDKTLGVSWLKTRGFRSSGCCPLACTGLVSVPDIGTSSFRCYPFWNVWQNKMIDMDGMFEATMMMSNYGLDNRNICTTVSYLQKMYEMGVITAKDTDGIAMEWGSREALTETIRKVANREGFGDIFAEGPLALAKKLGGKALELFSHTRGQVIAGDERRHNKGYALGDAVSTTRATEVLGLSSQGLIWERHAKEFGQETDIKEAYEKAKKNFGTEKAALPDKWEGKPQMVINANNLSMIDDTVGICLFYTGFEFPEVQVQGLHMYLAGFKAVTGMSFDEKYFTAVGERAWNVEKAYLVREGLTRDDDAIADLWHKVPIIGGQYDGAVVEKDELERAKSKYYELRGWDVETSWPTKETYERLELEDVAKSLDKLGRVPKKKGK